MVLIREQELQRLEEDLQVKEDEIKKVKEPLSYKEEELLRREEDLLYREKVLQAEHRKVEKTKAHAESDEELDLKSRLEELKSTITAKEEEVRTKERYLQRKMEDLRLREQGLISEDIEARDKDLQVEVKQQKVKMGIPRLDDLLFGGIPFGTNASVYGPAYVGKEVLVSLFMAEGLKRGVPGRWILPDKGPADVREEMAFALPGYEEYEKLGLVRYIDAYSKSMGADASDPNTTYIDEPTDHQAILKAVDARAAEWKKKYPTYRLAFRSVSTLIAYLDPTTTFKFLQPFVGRRKRDKAVAFYVIEKGMHEEQEIQMLGSLMDGSIEFKVEQLKSFLSIKGICDVQSRGWIRYTYTTSSVSVESFGVVAEPPTNLVLKGTDRKDNVPGRPDEMVHELGRPGPPRDGGVRLPLLGNLTRAVSANASHERGRFGCGREEGGICWDHELVCRRAGLKNQFRTGMLLRGHLSTS